MKLKSLLCLAFLLVFPVFASAAQFTLSWADNSTNETGFTIERAVDGATFVVITNVGVNVTSYVDAGLPPESTYWYRLCAYNVAGKSGYSNTASGTTPPPAPVAPGAPALQGDAPYTPPPPVQQVVHLAPGENALVVAAAN